MGILDSLKGLPFSWSGDYTPFYQNAKGKEDQLNGALGKTDMSVSKSDAEKLPVTTPVSPSIAELDALQKHRLALQVYQEKLKDREAQIARKERESLQRIESANNDLKIYSKALYETEYRIMDYVRRFDEKEISLFEEIQKNAVKFDQYNSDPSKDGFQFEHSFAEILKKNGFCHVVVTQQSNDFGADITAEKDSVKYVIQCKYYISAVGIEAVQQIYSAKIHYGAHVAVVATNSVFTHAAQVLAEETGVLLWDCEKIAAMNVE